MDKPLPPYPNRCQGFTYHEPCGSLGDEVFDAEAFQRARAEFYKARLDHAVRNLAQAAKTFETAGYPIAAGAMRDVIKDIGPLPPDRG